MTAATNAMTLSSDDDRLYACLLARRRTPWDAASKRLNRFLDEGETSRELSEVVVSSFSIH